MSLAQVPPKSQPDFNLILKRLDKIESLLQGSKLEHSNLNTTNTFLQISNEYLRPKEVCSIFGISRTKFDNLKRGGVFPFKKIGKDVVVLRSDLDKFFSAPKTNF